MANQSDVQVIEEKATKIKLWVNAKLQELEEQNKRLRIQNMLCSRRLEILQRSEMKSSGWKNNLMTCSVDGAGMLIRKAATTDADKQRQLAFFKNGGVDDECLVGGGDVGDGEKIGRVKNGAHGNFLLEWPEIQQQRRTASVERISYNYCREKLAKQARPDFEPYSSKNCHSLPRNSFYRPDEYQQQTQEINAKNNNNNNCYAENQSPTNGADYRSNNFPADQIDCCFLRSSSSPNHKKPVPKPRTNKSSKNSAVGETGRLMSNSSSGGNENNNDDADRSCYFNMERDSLEPNINYTNMSNNNGTSSGRYKNNEKAIIDTDQYLKDKAKLEQQLYDLAQSCFMPSTSTNGKRDTYVPGDPKHKSSLGRSTTIDQPISVPIYCVYSGNEKHAHKSGGNNNDASGSESVRSSKETGGGTTSSSSTCQKLCGTADDFGSFNSNSHRKSGAYKCAEELTTSSDDDYALPPDAVDLSSQELKIKCVAEDGARYDMTTSVKLSGYLNKLGNKTKTWKKRWFVLKEDALRYFRSQIDQDKKDPCGVINVSDIIGLSRLSGSSSTDGFEIITNKGRYCLSTEETGNTNEWFKSLQVCRKEAIAKKVKDKSDTCHVFGWLTKVYFGRSKRYWCVLSDSCLIFYKRPSAQLPKTQLCLSNVQIKEPPKSSEDESDGELNGQTNYSYRQYSVEIVLPDHSITYLLFSTAEEKEKWMYHLTLAANGGPKTNGSAFEFLVNKLMEVDGNSESVFWNDPLLITCPEKLSTTLTTIPDEADQKLAKNLYHSIHLFSTVPMRVGALDYHIDLAQNALTTALTNPNLRDEFLASMVKLTGSGPEAQQAWRLLALSLSLFPPVRYPVAWLIKKYLHKKLLDNDVKLSFPILCKKAMDRCLLMGPRRDPPSRLEVIGFLARDPSEHNMPHSIPINLPDGSYQVIGFDGSSIVDECSQHLCQLLNLRSARLSGYCLNAEDPKLSGSLQPLSAKDKLCDVLSRWEKSLKEVTAGRIPTNRVIQLAFKQRFYWRHLSQDRTDKETLFQAYDSCKEVKNDRIPVSTELAVELCALFCQMHFGKCKKSLTDDQALESAVKKCLADKLIAASCKNTLRQRILDRWGELSDKGMSAADSASGIVLALKLWPHFGSKMFDATLKWKAEEPVLLAVSDLGLTILEAYTMDQINTYPFESIIKFGGLRNDFVVVVHRPSYSENESSQERLIFGMAKLQIYEATLYIADYIKARRGVYLKQTCSFSPRRQILVENRKL